MDLFIFSVICLFMFLGTYYLGKCFAHIKELKERDKV